MNNQHFFEIQVQRKQEAQILQTWKKIETCTHIDWYSRQEEKLSWWIISRNISVEFVAIFVPLDRVQRLAVQVKVTFELDGAIFGHVVRNADFRQSQTEADIWNGEEKWRNLKVVLVYFRGSDGADNIHSVCSGEKDSGSLV